jgi:hypothetical protein
MDKFILLGVLCPLIAAREKINFKNYLLVLGRSLVKLVYSIYLIASHWLDNLIQGTLRSIYLANMYFYLKIQ